LCGSGLSGSRGGNGLRGSCINGGSVGYRLVVNGGQFGDLRFICIDFILSSSNVCIGLGRSSDRSVRNLHSMNCIGIGNRIFLIGFRCLSQGGCNLLCRSFDLSDIPSDDICIHSGNSGCG